MQYNLTYYTQEVHNIWLLHSGGTEYLTSDTRWSNKGLVRQLWFLSEFMSYTAGVL